MKLQSSQPLKFSFHFLNPQGQATTMFSRKGTFDGAILTLDKQTIPVEQLLQAWRREQRLALTVLTGPTEAESIVISCVYKNQAPELKKAIDIVLSRHWANRHREDLIQRGRGATYRDAECKSCSATIVLSDMARTPQVYCPFCDTLATLHDGEDVPANETAFRVCDSCGMFSQPQKFTKFYFWFVIVAYGYWSQEIWCCRACMRSHAWKMIWGNLVGFIGVPFAMVQLGRAYSGSMIGGVFRGLDSGNVRAAKKDISGAIKHYRTILERVPHSAGVKFNLGQALLMQQNFDQAARSFEAALQDCANYVPAYGQLRQIYAHLEDAEKLKLLEAEWGVAETQAAAAQDADDDQAA